MKLILRSIPHCLEPFVNSSTELAELELFGRPLLSRNIAKLLKIYPVTKVEIPHCFAEITNLLSDEFGNLDFIEYGGNSYDVTNFTSTLSTALQTKEMSIQGSDSSVELPVNCVITGSLLSGLSFHTFTYPWDYLKAIHIALYDDIVNTEISSNCSVAKSAVIEGPCKIEEGVEIDDFTKIRGPIYIGKGSFIGMGSLVRNCVFEKNVKIGFNSEIGRCYFAGNDKISHQNVILDTIIGSNVWFGGYSGTANVLLTRKNIRYCIDSKLFDTGVDHFGAVVGNNSCIGAAVIILPGRRLEPDSIINAGSIVDK